MSRSTRHDRPRNRTRLAAGVTAVAVVTTTLLVTSTPAQARPRSCANIEQSMLFFWNAMELDTGPAARYLASDTRWYNYEVALYRRSNC